MINYYRILGVSPSAEPEVISAAFKAMMRKYHPDAGGQPNSTQRAAELNEAYNTLRSAERRAAYDAALAKASVSEPSPPSQPPPPRPTPPPAPEPLTEKKGFGSDFFDGEYRGFLPSLFRDAGKMAGIIICVFIVGGLAAAFVSDEPSPSDRGSNLRTEVSSENGEGLVGSWVQAERGGEDGNTKCVDAETMTTFNGGSTSTMDFYGNGTVESTLWYDTAFSYQGEPQVKAAYNEGTWALNGDSLLISWHGGSTGLFASDLDAGELESPISLGQNGNVLTLENDGSVRRFVRCIGGSVALANIETPNALVEESPWVPRVNPAIPPIDLCTDQQTINEFVGPFKEAIAQIILADAASFEDVFVRAIAMKNEFESARYKFRNIRSLGVDGADDGTLTVKCQTNLRMVWAIPDTDESFSQYIQFNDAYYTIRIRNYGSDSSQAYLLAEIRPINGSWDISQGTE